MARLSIVLLVAVCLLVAAYAVVHHWNRDIERLAGLTRTEEASTPSSLTSLLSAPVQSVLGDVVFLNDVSLQPGPKPDIFLVTGSAGEHMLLVSAEPYRVPPKKADIKGFIRKLPGGSILRREWHLNKQEVQAFGDQQVYIAADSIKPQELTTSN